MSKILSNRKLVDGILGAALLIAMAALLFYPTESIDAAKDGILLCYNVIIPSLFPFFVLSSLVVEFGLAGYIGRALEPVMRPLFNVSGTCSVAFTLGIIGGYPVGARTAINLYEKGMCTKTETERLLSFSNNSGPAFILGVVGAGIFSSSRIGLLLYLTHILASVCVGVIFRFYRRGDTSKSTQSSRESPPQNIGTVKLSAAFTETVKNAFMSTLGICAFVIFFTVFIKLLFTSGILTALAKFIAVILSPYGMTQAWAERLLTGIIEISSGVNSLRGVQGSLTGSLAMAAFMLGWAGLSVHCQVMSFIGRSGISVKTYIIGKALHGIISSVLILLLSKIFLPNTQVAGYLVEQIQGISTMDFRSALTVSAAVSWGVWVAFVLLATRIMKKNTGKKRRKGV